MRRTGKRAFEPTMGSEGMSQLLITYSIFMAGILAKRRVFSHNPGKKTGTRRCPSERALQGSLYMLHVVRGLAVRVDVQTLALFFLGDAQAHEQIRDLARDEGHDRGPDEYQANGLRLDPELRHDSRVAALHGDPVLNRAGSAQVGRVEHAGHERAEDPADGMHAEDVESVVRTQHLLQAVHAPQAHQANADTDHERARDADVAGSRGDRDQAGNRAGCRADHARLALEEPLTEHPR